MSTAKSDSIEPYDKQALRELFESRPWDGREPRRAEPRRGLDEETSEAPRGPDEDAVAAEHACCGGCADEETPSGPSHRSGHCH